MSRHGACHDEINVYRFSESAARPGWFSGTGSKVVSGKETSIGTLDWQYDAKSHILERNNPSGSFRSSVKDNKIDGTLILLPDDTVYRRIQLTKDEVTFATTEFALSSTIENIVCLYGSLMLQTDCHLCPILRVKMHYSARAEIRVLLQLPRLVSLRRERN